LFEAITLHPVRLNTTEYSQLISPKPRYAALVKEVLGRISKIAENFVQKHVNSRECDVLVSAHEGDFSFYNKVIKSNLIRMTIENEFHADRGRWVETVLERAAGV
jgi:hypothetical protein